MPLLKVSIMQITRQQFEELVSGVINSLPEEFGSKLENVDVVVEDWPGIDDLKSVNVKPGMTLFGLYRGIPRTKRGNYNAVIPDKIVIFAGPIVTAHGQGYDSLKNQIRSTVLHEIGHHFGMSEEDIRNALR